MKKYPVESIAMGAAVCFGDCLSALCSMFKIFIYFKYFAYFLI